MFLLVFDQHAVQIGELKTRYACCQGERRIAVCEIAPAGELGREAAFPRRLDVWEVVIDEEHALAPQNALSRDLDEDLPFLARARARQQARLEVEIVGTEGTNRLVVACREDRGQPSAMESRIRRG